MIPAFAYMRCSGQGQVDGDTWDRQSQAIHTYVDPTPYQVVSWFRDEGVSGKTELVGRQGLTDCMARCQAEGITTVIVESADRLARDMIISELIIREFQKIGVQVISASGGVNLTEGDDSNPTSKLIRQILAAFAEFERSSIVNKLRAARQRERSRNGRCEGVKPFGTLPGEEIILALMQGFRQEGSTSLEVAARLNRMEAESRSGKPWHASTVAKILARHRISPELHLPATNVGDHPAGNPIE